MHAFILAGGFATRLWPLTETRAKPLLPIAGKPIIEYLIEKIPAGLPITISTNATFETQFRDWLNTLKRQDITLLIEDTNHDDHKLGALGATSQWITQKQIQDDILLLTGDNYLGFEMQQFLDRYINDTPLLAAYDLKDISKASAFGTVIVDAKHANRAIGFEEKPKEPKTSLVSTGCCIIPKAHIPLLQSYAEKHPDNVGGIFEEFLAHDIPVDVFTFDEPWLDIGSFASYIEAHQLLIGTQPQVDASSTVETSDLLGSVFIDEHAHITRSTLTDCVVFPGCTIENCILTRCVIDEGSKLTNVDLTGKMIRKKTTLVRDLS